MLLQLLLQPVRRGAGGTGAGEVHYPYRPPTRHSGRSLALLWWKFEESAEFSYPVRTNGHGKAVEVVVSLAGVPPRRPEPARLPGWPALPTGWSDGLDFQFPTGTPALLFTDGFETATTWGTWSCGPGF
jgi:hypothetical protein